LPRGKKIIEICRTYAERKEETNMGLPGVFMARKKDHSVYYRSSITVREKHISLGSYPTELEAHLAYKEARKRTPSGWQIIRKILYFLFRNGWFW
jgi:hypothetical protein